ncbi:hypothetical protein B0J14DRAFT_701532 [Halenospora varia]|nr:hypothetical protein B0J14DRAFT_701532 [Halenospora varia]
MPSHPYNYQISFYALLLISLFAHVFADTTVSIISDSSYAQARGCIQLCVWHVGADDDLIVYLGCVNNGGWQNSCYCRADQSSSATYFFSSCVNSRCAYSNSNPYDISSYIATATTIYSRYCSTAMAGVTPVSVPATTTGNLGTKTEMAVQTMGSGSPTTSPSTKSTPTATDSTSSETTALSKGSGLSTSDRIAIGIGIGIGIPTFIVTFVACWITMIRR